MIRICHVMQTAALRGAQRNLLELLRRLDRSRFEPHLVTPGPGPLVHAARKLAVRCHYVSRLGSVAKAWRNTSAVPALDALFREQGIAIVQTYGPRVGVAAQRAVRKAGVPYAVHSTHGFSHKAKAATRWAKWSRAFDGRDCDRVLFANSEQRRAALAAGQTPEQCHTLFSGVDLERFHPQRRRPCRAQWQLDEDEVIIACATSLESHKQPLLLADIAAAIDRRVGADCCWKLCVMGQGAQRDRLLRRAARLGVSNRLRWLGWHPEPHKFLPAIDILTSPALTAGLPVSLVEGMACGLPLVASNIAGHRDVVTDETGFLCEPRDAQAFAARITRLMFDRHLRQRMGRRARRRAREQFDIEQIATQLTRVYDSLTAPATPRVWRAAA